LFLRRESREGKKGRVAAAERGIRIDNRESKIIEGKISKEQKALNAQAL